jgi:hypothetical protein
MILKIKNPIFGGWNRRAAISTNFSMSNHKSPALLIDGKPISPKETVLEELEVVKASPREVEALKNEGHIK